VIVITLLIDGDGCPVTETAVRLCNQYGIPCVIFCDTSHEFYREGVQTMVVDKGADSVDYAIANRVCRNDVVITQDYGLASMCLAKGCRVLHQDGWEYTADNIEALLLVRHESRKHRAAGGRWKGMKKRRVQQDRAFEAALSALLQTAVQG